MPEEQQFKRNIAFKLRIADLLAGKSVIDPDMQRFNFLELGDKKIIRINIVANVVDKYVSEGESKFVVLTLDDGSGQIKMRAFSEDSEKIKNFVQGQTILVIGLLRSYNNEIYITPEIVREQDSRYLLVRKLEIEKQRNQIAKVFDVGKPEIKQIKDKIIDFVKNAEAQGGADTETLIITLREASPESINSEIKKLLENGTIFEPRPGKLRWLG